MKIITCVITCLLFVLNINAQSTVINTGKNKAKPGQSNSSNIFSAADWNALGNSDINDTFNFIGTTNKVALKFRIANLPAGEINPANNNTGFGEGVFTANTNGNRNTAIGYNAMKNASGNATLNIAVGFQALLNSQAAGNVAVGSNTLLQNTTGGGNVAIGDGAMGSTTTGSNNIGIGNTTLISNTGGTFNIGLGLSALGANTTGNNNIAVGTTSLRNNTIGSNNTALGHNAGKGGSGISFTQCTFLGSESFPTVARTNVTMLGFGIANAQCTGNNQVLLGNTSISQIRAQVTGITAYSDARFKTNINDNVKGLDFIMRLKPVTYNQRPRELHKIWGDLDEVKDVEFTETEKQLQIGFLAQDVEAAAKASGFNFPGIDIPASNKEVYTLRYVDFIMPVVKATQEQQQQIENLKSQNELLKKQNEEILKRLALLEKAPASAGIICVAMPEGKKQ